jgi:hypothetical protein
MTSLRPADYLGFITHCMVPYSHAIMLAMQAQLNHCIQILPFVFCQDLIQHNNIQLDH